MFRYLRKSNEKGYIDVESIMAPVIGLVIFAAMILAIPKVINSVGREAFNNEAVSATQMELKTQGYVISKPEIYELIGNDSGFLSEGGKGPEVAVTFENVGTEKVYLEVKKNSSVITPVLKYSSDGSLVASPNAIPEDSKENW